MDPEFERALFHIPHALSNPSATRVLHHALLYSSASDSAVSAKLTKIIFTNSSFLLKWRKWHYINQKKRHRHGRFTGNIYRPLGVFQDREPNCG
jgi:hypothetical protein